MNPYRQPSQRYREVQVTSANPLQRTLMVYDAAILACRKGDLKGATAALNVLRNSLDLEQGPVAIGLFRLYQYCADLARKGKYEEAAHILQELVQAWVEVLVRQEDAARQASSAQDALTFIC